MNFSGVFNMNNVRRLPMCNNLPIYLSHSIANILKQLWCPVPRRHLSIQFVSHYSLYRKAASLITVAL